MVILLVLLVLPQQLVSDTARVAVQMAYSLILLDNLVVKEFLVAVAVVAVKPLYIMVALVEQV